MRLVGPAVVAAYPDAVLNIHPSLLPAFPGLDAQRRAFDHGVKVSGATVHLVTNELDDGPIVLQARCRCGTRIRPRRWRRASWLEEHRIYPEAIGIVLAGGWRIEGRRFVQAGD